MAERKQFSSIAPVSDRLRVLLERARAEGVSNEVLKEQRVSFAFGNAPASARITKQSVQRASEHIRLRG